MIRVGLWALLAVLAAQAAAITIDYPADGSVFPPEFPAPTFLWRDGDPQAAEWRIEVRFTDGAKPLQVTSRGERMRIGEIDERCLGPTNEPPKLTAEQAAAHTWAPDAATWAAIKAHSVKKPATITIRNAGSAARVTLSTSKDPVGAPIFYRDVPLMPSELKKGIIKPLSASALPLIEWRLRNVGETKSRVLLTGMHTCANCHSFSLDGKTMGMDIDGPGNDKGLYAAVAVKRQIEIRNSDVLSWRGPNDPVSPDRVGFMTQVSPDGRYLLTRLSGPGGTLPSGFYVANFKDYRFLQVFYPTRGILAWYDRAAGRSQALPGADDTRYVQTDGVWSPDGKYIVFVRAEAKEPYPPDRKVAEYANDPNEIPIQYDVFRVPFSGGKGGLAKPVPGASANGMSNTFPRVSPDGRWIVFVQCKNGQLMRPDSQLFIVPAKGGAARRMRSNTSLMNSWHSFSPNSRWMVFSSKSRSPYTQMYLTHLDKKGNDSPAILIENATAANRAVNIPEFVNVSPGGMEKIEVPAGDFYRQFDLATELADKGDYAAAIPAWKQAIELNPEDARAQLNLGLALAAAGEADEAVASYRKARELDPKNAASYSNEGVVLARKGEYDQAIPLLQKALELFPQDEPTRGNLCGALALSQSRTADAIAYCQQAVEARPADAARHANLAIALSKAGRTDESIAHLEKAAELVPDDATIQGNLGTALAQKGRIPEAIAHFESALRLAPQSTELHHYLGVLYAMQGRGAEALAHWRTLLTVQPNHLPALYQASQLLATSRDDSLRNGAEAVELAERAVKLSGEREPTLLDALAAAYAEAGRFTDAVETARRALALAADPELAAGVRARLALFESNRPFRR